MNVGVKVIVEVEVLVGVAEPVGVKVKVGVKEPVGVKVAVTRRVTGWVTVTGAAGLGLLLLEQLMKVVAPRARTDRAKKVFRCFKVPPWDEGS